MAEVHILTWAKTRDRSRPLYAISSLFLIRAEALKSQAERVSGENRSERLAVERNMLPHVRWILFWR
jgi:hypothetical protein